MRGQQRGPRLSGCCPRPAARSPEHQTPQGPFMCRWYVQSALGKKNALFSRKAFNETQQPRWNKGNK